MEGGKGLLRIAKNGLCEQKAFCLWKREILEDSEKRLVQMKGFCM